MIQLHHIIKETDSLRSEQIYQQFGMKTISEQKLNEKESFYILQSQ